MAIAIELDPEQLGCAADKAGGGYDRSPGAPLELHPAAMRAACDLIDRLYQNGILDILRALASSSGDIAGKMAEGADTAQAVRVIRNGLALLSILGQIDPAIFQTISSAPRSPQAAQDNADPPGLWSLFRRLESSDSRRGLALLTGIVESIGRAAKPAEGAPPAKAEA